MKSSVLTLLLFPILCPAQDLTEKIQGFIQQDVQSSRAFWGVQAVSLKTGTSLATINQDRFFVPASNAKLYSTALALLRLGPDYRFRTRVTVESPPVEGTISGNLRLAGGSDPSMSWRIYPYQKGPETQYPLLTIEELADQVLKQGIRRIEGDIIGDDTRWPWDPYPAGWAIDDALWEYGAPVSALTLNDNAIRINVQPSTPGLAPALTLTPPLEYYWIDNQIRTEAGERKLEIIRDAGSRQLLLQGRIAPRSTGRTFTVAIDDPALFAATALYDALSRRGIVISGQAKAEHRSASQPYPESTASIELASRNSVPLLQILKVINKVSQNLHAEMMLREVGFFLTKEGTTDAGIKELRRLLDEAGVNPDSYDLRDGSGLSRLTLTTPAATTQLLTHLYQSRYRAEWLQLMPIGGEDGTLENRFLLPGRSRKAAPGAASIRAKTGSLSHVNTLSGYIDSKTHGSVAFSIMVNNFNGPSSGIRAVIDKICLELAQ